jgi:hypothetical protein
LHSIRADFEVETPGVFLNFAAYLSSRLKGLNVIPSILPLFTDSSLEFDVSFDDFIDQGASLAKSIPSWVLNSKRWSSPKLELIGIGKERFTTCAQLSNNSMISSDGQILHIDIAKIDAVEHVWSGEIRCLVQTASTCFLSRPD